MNRHSTSPGLRPYLAEDFDTVLSIFLVSVDVLAAEDYSADQRAAWTAAVTDDVDAFGKRLAQQLTLVASVAGEDVGFISLKGKDTIDLLYVHPDHAGKGVGAALCEALERLAGARGVTALVADVSDNAEAFFRRRGYVAQQRNTVPRGDQWLGNTTMKKTLDPMAPETLQ